MALVEKEKEGKTLQHIFEGFEIYLAIDWIISYDWYDIISTIWICDEYNDPFWSGWMVKKSLGMDFIFFFHLL